MSLVPDSTTRHSQYLVFSPLLAEKKDEKVQQLGLKERFPLCRDETPLRRRGGRHARARIPGVQKR